jgi:hypothetical protein
MRGMSIEAGSRPRCIAAGLPSGSRSVLNSTATCAREATHLRLSTARFAKSTGTSAAKCLNQGNEEQMIPCLCPIGSALRSVKKAGGGKMSRPWPCHVRSSSERSNLGPISPAAQRSPGHRFEKTPCRIEAVWMLSQRFPRHAYYYWHFGSRYFIVLPP